MSRCAQDESLKEGVLTFVSRARNAFSSPFSKCPSRFPQHNEAFTLSQAAHTSCILGFFCHPWETAWWSGIMGIRLTKSWFPIFSSSRSSGCSGKSSGLQYGSATNGIWPWRSFSPFFLSFLICKYESDNAYLLGLLWGLKNANCKIINVPSSFSFFCHIKSSLFTLSSILTQKNTCIVFHGLEGYRVFEMLDDDFLCMYVMYMCICIYMKQCGVCFHVFLKTWKGYFLKNLIYLI